MINNNILASEKSGTITKLQMIQIGNSRDPYDRIAEAVGNLRYLKTLPIGSVVEFAEGGFVRPISIVPIAIIGFNKSFRFSNIPEYCINMDFPNGQEISGYTSDGGTYVPLTRADLQDLGPVQRERKLRTLSDRYSSMLQRNIITDLEFLERIGKNVAALLISEMVDNINEHSEAVTSFIHSQFWPGNNSCEICLADNGVGIYQSLVGAGRNVTDDIDAITKVIQERLSAKNEGGSQKRGTGIMNTINLLSNNELNGYFCVISGSAGYFIDSTGREFFLDLQSISWNGTIINMGFNKPQHNFDIYEHIR